MADKIIKGPSTEEESPIHKYILSNLFDLINKRGGF